MSLVKIDPKEELLVKEAVEAEDALMSCKKDVTVNMLKLGLILSQIEDKKLFKYRGYETFDDYIESPEISFGRAWAHRLKGVYRFYVEDMGSKNPILSEVGTNKLELIKKVANKENLDEWVDKANKMSYMALRNEILGEVKREKSVVLRYKGQIHDGVELDDNFTSWILSNELDGKEVAIRIYA
jgi:hypothetical protein